MTRADIENAILATFLDANDMFDDLSKAYKLNTSIFTSPFRKRVAENINDVEDGNFGFLNISIEEKTMGTAFEQDFIDMTSQYSLGLEFSKKYHDDLVAKTEVEALL